MPTTSSPSRTTLHAVAAIGASLALVVAGSPPALAAESWSVTASPTAENSTTVRAGSTITISAKAPACAAGQATIWWSDGITLRWRPAQRVTVNSTCQVSMAIPGGLRTTDHRFAVTRNDKPPVDGAGIVRIRAVPRISIDLPRTMGLDATPTATVDVSQHSSTRVVEVQASTASGTSMVYRTQVADSGRMRFPFTFRRATAGEFRLRVVVNLGSGSPHASGWVSYTRAAPTINACIRHTTTADVAKTYRSGCPVGPSGLSTIEMNYWGYDGKVKRGSLIVRRNLAHKVLAAFAEAFTRRWPIQNMASPNLYGGNDIKMMAAGHLGLQLPPGGGQPLCSVTA